MRALFLTTILLVAASSAFSQGAVRPVVSPTRAVAPHRGYLNSFPWYFGDTGYEAYSPAPSVVMIEQPPLYVVVPAAASAAPKAEMHEYSNAATADEQAFAIVLKDGSVHSAMAVTVQATGLYFVEPDGAHRLVKLDALDREATARLNRERKLQLQLPAQ